jgi:hypothetical protein
VHRAEVMTDERERGAAWEALAECIEGGAQPPLLELDVGHVGVGIDRVGTPRQAAGRQDASNAQASVVAGLRQELRAVASMLAEPVQEEDPGAGVGARRLDGVRLDGGIARAEDDVPRPNPCRGVPPPGHRGHCA